MVTAILIGTIILVWKITVFVMRVFLQAMCYMLAFMVAFVIYASSFMLNIFTVPLYILVYIAQKRCGDQLPYVGRWLLILYPTFTDPKVTEVSRMAKRAARQPQKVRVVAYDWLSDPLFWSY